MKYDTNINKNNNSKSFKYDTNINRMTNSTKKKDEFSTKGALIFIGVALLIVFIVTSFNSSPSYYDSNDYDRDGDYDLDDGVKYLEDSINSQK